MAENLNISSALGGGTSRPPGNGYLSLALAAAGAFAVCFASALPTMSQSVDKREAEGNLLPPTVGQPLTIKPLDMQDVDCAVAQWNVAAPKPVLTLICPPNAVLAPLRILVKLSWMKPRDIPIEPNHILAPAGTLTKIRTNKDAALIRLRVEDKSREPQETWVAFNAVVDFALLAGRPR